MEGEETRVLGFRPIGVLMPRPGRDTEDVALLPVEARPADDRMTASFGHLVNEATGMAVRLGSLSRTQQLHARAHGAHHMTAGHGIDIVEPDRVERRAFDDLRV